MPGPFLRPVGVVTMVLPNVMAGQLANRDDVTSSEPHSRRKEPSRRDWRECRSILSHTLPRRDVIVEAVVTRSERQTPRCRSQHFDVDVPMGRYREVETPRKRYGSKGKMPTKGRPNDRAGIVIRRGSSPHPQGSKARTLSYKPERCKIG